MLHEPATQLATRRERSGKALPRIAAWLWRQEM